MAKKPTSSPKKSTAVQKSTPVRRSPVPKKPKAGSTPVRNTSVPKAKSKPAAAAAKAAPTYEQIAVRAYEISQSPQCGSEFDNWCRAERELRGV
jgi:hypothetical protein